MKFLLTSIISVGLVGAAPNLSAAVSATTEGTGTITPITSGNSINPGAQTGKKSQDSGAAMNMAAAAMLMAACMATQPPNMALCMMGAMAAMQGGEDKDAAGQSGATQTATNTSGAGTGTNAPTYAAAAAGSATFDQQKKIDAGLQTLKDAGYKATPAGISSSGGLVPASAFSSSGSMLAAGLDPAAVKEAEKISKDVSSKYGTMSLAADASGAGGGGSGNESNSNSDAESPLSGSAPKDPFAIGSAKKAEMMAGKTVQFDGEPIGVKGNDIFQMVHLAYDRKREGKHFIETDHDPELNVVRPRAPASVIKTAAPRPLSAWPTAPRR